MEVLVASPMQVETGQVWTPQDEEMRHYRLTITKVRGKWVCYRLITHHPVWILMQTLHNDYMLVGNA